MGLDLYHFKVCEIPQTEYEFEEECFPKEKFVEYGFSSYLSKSIYPDENYLVVSHREVAYQRKGMLLEFYNAYVNDGIYTERKDFEDLLKYIDEKLVTSSKRNIQENFIDKYVKGKSFLYVSW